MFPENEFWQCPSNTWSSFVIGIMVSIVIAMSFTVNNDIGTLVASAGVILTLLWSIRTLIHWFKPDLRCAAVGFPGQHYINPFA